MAANPWYTRTSTSGTSTNYSTRGSIYENLIYEKLFTSKDIFGELKKIKKEMDEDKQKDLPLFDPAELDI